MFGPGLPDGVESIVKVSGSAGHSLVIRNKVNDNYVQLRFYLGLASNPSGEVLNSRLRHKLTGLYRGILAESGIVAEFESTRDNMSVYISDNKRWS